MDIVRITEAPLRQPQIKRDTTLKKAAYRLALYLPEPEKASEKESGFSTLLSVLWSLLKFIPSLIGAIMTNDKPRFITIAAALVVALLTHFLGIGSDWVIPFTDAFVDGGLTLQSAVEGLAVVIAALFTRLPADKKAMQNTGN